MQCSCATTTLVVFIRSIAHFDIQTSIHRATNQHSLFLLRHKTVFGYQQRQIHYGAHLRKSSGTQTALDPTPSNSEKVLEIAGKWHSETAQAGNLVLKNHATDKSKDLSVPKERHMEQQVTPKCDTKYNTDTMGFTPTKDLSISNRGFNVNDEALELEINSSAIDTRHLNKSNHKKELRGNFHETIWPKFNLGITSAIETPIAELGRRQKHDSKEKKSMFVISSSDGGKKSNASREHWQIQKAALDDKFKDGWNPRKRLSPDALAGIRAIHAQFPDQYPTSILAEKFEVSPEAIRRILKSKWTPKEDEALDRQRRWFSRGRNVWGRFAELGFKPPVRWRKLGIGRRGKRGNQSRTGAKITLRGALTTSDDRL